MHVVGCVCVWNFERGGECETPENPDFLRKDKMVILVKI